MTPDPLTRTVLFVIHYPMFGGPHNQALRLDAPLRARGWRTVVALPDEPGNAASRLRDGGVEVVTLPLHRARADRDPRLVAKWAAGLVPETLNLARLARAQRADLVMLGGLINPHAAFAARRVGLPVVWQVLDARTPGPVTRVLRPVVNRLADCVLWPGTSLIAPNFGDTPLRPPQRVYLPPVDTERFHPSPERRAETRAALGIPAEAPVVGTVANLAPVKGVEYVIRAAGRLYRDFPDLRVLIVGEAYDTAPDYPALLRAEVLRAGLPPDRVIFTGGRSDVERYYPAMDVSLIGSLPQTEGTTTTAQEAGACGVPVVAHDIGGLHEVITDGHNGFLVPAFDTEQAAAASARLLSDRALLQRVGAAGRAVATERFSVEVCADVHIDVFETALRHHAARRGGGPPEPSA